MRRLNIDPATVVAAVLAVLLIAYVFAGGGRENSGSQVHCTSRGNLDAVKIALFHRAAAVRGTNAPLFSEVANYAAIRTNSRVLRSAKSNLVNCSGAIMIDLPPGVQVVGGRRSLGANVAYVLLAGAGGSAQLQSLSKADDIVQLLATLARTGSPVAAPQSPNAKSSEAFASVKTAPVSQPQAPERSAPIAEPPLTMPAQQKRTTATPPALSAPRPARSRPSHPVPTGGSTSDKQRSEVPPAEKPSPEKVTGLVAARPSFNCGYAHTRSEIAICRNPDLADLDREMSRHFYGALSGASPGARLMLLRSRDRFLRYRDSCDSDACIAEAYRDRIREISDIMSRF